LLTVAAIEACKKNIQHNGSLASSKVVPHHADARVYMLTHPKEFDVVLPSFYFHVCFLFFSTTGTRYPIILRLSQRWLWQARRQGRARKAEITDRRGQVLKTYVIRGDKSIFFTELYSKISCA
jgi:hypothetical protein